MHHGLSMNVVRRDEWTAVFHGGSLEEKRGAWCPLSPEVYRRRRFPDRVMDHEH